MNIVKRIAKAKPEKHMLDLSITTTGLNLMVTRGPIRIKGVDYTMDDDIGHTVSPDPDSPVMVQGYIEVDPKNAGVVDLVVSEDIIGEEVGYKSPPGRKVLHRLFDFVVPAGATNLDSVDAQVYAFAAPPAQPEEPAQ